MFLLFFPRFHRPSQEQAGNGVGSKLHQPTFHLLTVFPYPCGTEAVSDFQAMRKEAIEHFEGVLRMKTSSMTLMVFGISKEEKEELGYRKGPRGYYKRLI